MVELWFDGSRDTRLLGSFPAYTEAFSAMSDFLRKAERDNGFHWYYTRLLFRDEERTIWCDVGSHIEFFRFVFPDQDSYEKERSALCSREI